jgi:hypothetical protein
VYETSRLLLGEQDPVGRRNRRKTSAGRPRRVENHRVLGEERHDQRNVPLFLRRLQHPDDGIELGSSGPVREGGATGDEHDRTQERGSQTLVHGRIIA